MQAPKFTVSEFLSACNQTLDTAYASIIIEGEVSGFKVNQGKWVFFDLKDDESSIGCFMTLWQLNIPLEDGMKVVVRGTPKITKWGKFSFTVTKIQPVGEGSIKKSFEMLKNKLTKEGLFDPARKRPLPADLTKIGVISSTAAAGYADFIKIINERWSGLDIQVAHTQVQGLDAPEQIIRALKYFNEHAEVQIIAILRGGGSADDLAAFNDEQLVRAIASSRIPVITGIGHEIDESLSDLVADICASTPSNAAQMLTKDRHAEVNRLYDSLKLIKSTLNERIDTMKRENSTKIKDIYREIVVKITTQIEQVKSTERILVSLDPEQILKRGYSILSGDISIGNVVKITTKNQLIKAEVKDVKTRS